MKKFEETSDSYVMWHCPGCNETHGVPVNCGRGWKYTGGPGNPTLSPSILYNVGRSNPTRHLCHSFIEDGRIRFLDDCTHALAGQTVDVPEWS